MRSIYGLKFLLVLILILCFSTSALAIFNSIGNVNGIGSPLANNQIGGESFIRHIGNDKLIFDFKSGSGATVKDRSREGNNGTLGDGSNVTTFPTWKRNSLYFDGGDYVDLTGINHRIDTGEFTFCFSFDTFWSSVTILNQETIGFKIAAYLDKVYLYTTEYTYITDALSIISPIDFQVTRNVSGNLECYVNSKASKKNLSDTSDITYNGISTINLGATFTPSHYITGTMYSFRILNKCLSGIEAQNEYLCNKFRGNN